jgi:hypothetical protein
MSFAARSVGAILVLLVLSAPVRAQRENTVGTTLDFVGGAELYPRFNAPLAQSGTVPFVSTYPSISLNSQGEHSLITAGYVFGWRRAGTKLPADTKSHTASVGFSSRIGQRWNVEVEEAFAMTDDLQTFYQLRGVDLAGENLVFLLAPVVSEQAFRTNDASFGLSYSFSQRASLTFGGEHTLRDYVSANFATLLSDQQSSSLNVGYSRRISDRTEWTVSYTGSLYNFDNFNDALLHVARAGVRTKVARDVDLSFSAGPSHVKALRSNDSHSSYEATASIKKTIKGNDFQLSFSQDNGNSNGIGSVSNTRLVTLGFGRSLGRRTTVYADASAFQSKGVLDNTFDRAGTSAAVNMGFALSRAWSLQGGAQFQRHSKPAPLAFTQTRLFVSLRYSNPTLLRFR